MAVPRSGPTWRRIFAVLLFAVAASYAYYARDEFPHGGTKIGLTLGIIGLLLILLLTYFGIRKRSYKSTFGTLEQWMQSHIYLGILVFVILLLHTGGRFNDQIAVTTFILVGAVVFSGELVLGERKTLEVAPPVRVRAADGGAVEVRVEGRDRGLLGDAGEPARRTFRR